VARCQIPAELFIGIGISPTQAVIEVGGNKTQGKTWQGGQQIKQGTGISPTRQADDQRIAGLEKLPRADDTDDACVQV
jgi:hypothetical protein